MVANYQVTLPRERVLVAGGAGEVGEGLVRGVLRAGATVVVPSRSQERLDRLRAALVADGTLRDIDDDRLTLVQLDVGTEEGAERLAMFVRAGSPLRAAVVSLGGWWQGAPLTGVSLSLWRALLDASLTAHFLVARAVLPLIADRAGASYTLINGAGGMRAVPGAGPISVSAAAQLMLKDVLAVEHQTRAVRINALVLATPVRTRSRPNGAPDWLTADDAGAYVAHLVSDLATARGETIVLRDRAERPTPV